MKRIIVADDSGTARMFIVRCLDILGFQAESIREAADGAEVLELLKQEPADVILSDVNMPVMDGEELIKRLKASPRTNEIPIMMITSSKNPAREKELIDLGALAVLSKPISPVILDPVMQPFLEEEGE